MLFLLIGMIALIGGLRMALSLRRIVLAGNRILAEVKSAEMKWSARMGEVIYTPIVAFKGQGGRLKLARLAVAVTYPLGQFRKGAMIWVYRDPTKAHLVHSAHWVELYFSPGVLLLSGVVSLCIGIYQLQ